MAIGALIKSDAIKRAGIVDAELGWPRGTCLGRMTMLYAASQEGEGTSVAKGRVILEWACVEPADGERFLALCCQVKEGEDGEHIHFLERRDGGRYFIVGNPRQLEKISTFKARAADAGKASGVARAAKKADRTTSSTSSSTTSSPQVELESNPLPLPLPYPLPLPLPAQEESRECRTLSTAKPPRARPRVDPKPTYSEADLAVGSEWLVYALLEMPWKSADPSWTAPAFAEGLAALRRATGVSEDGTAQLLAFVSKDEFWRKNACSPKGLLKKSARNGERKIDNILVRMRTKEDRTLDTMQQWAKENYRE